MGIDSEAISQAYHDVRSDSTENSWAAFGYDGKEIVHLQTGVEYDDFLGLCTADERVYGFVRIMTGDEMSKRYKFVFITWVGDSVSVLKKARMSTDKAFVKDIVQNFAKEILASSRDEISLRQIEEVVRKAGGANYGTGK